MSVAVYLRLNTFSPCCYCLLQGTCGDSQKSEYPAPPARSEKKHSVFPHRLRQGPRSWAGVLIGRPSATGLQNGSLMLCITAGVGMPDARQSGSNCWQNARMLSAPISPLAIKRCVNCSVDNGTAGPHIVRPGIIPVTAVLRNTVSISQTRIREGILLQRNRSQIGD